jgi:HEAT repeats
VVTACALMDAERHVDAVALLSEQPDDAHPVDWAWMLTQRARARAEIGDVAPARQDAAAALRALVGDPDDVTASAIGAAAAELLFQTAPWGEESLDALITAIDTAVSWWRTQTVSTAFRAAADRTFREWTDDRPTMRIDFEDTVNDRLFAAVVSADLTGEQGTWRATGSLLARNTLMVQHAGGDTSRQTGALDELRRCGDEKSLDLAARRLWAIGPLGPLAEAARRIQPGSWTHTTARANLALWQHAGDVLDEATASDAARYCLDVVTDSSAFVSRTTPSFLVIPYTLDALRGLLAAADDAVHRDLARLIAGLPPVTDELEARGWARVAAALRSTVVAAADDRVAWRQVAVSQPDPRLAAALLGLLTNHDEPARELLRARIAGGDNHALAALGPDHVHELDAQVAEQLMAQDAELLDVTIAELQQGAHAIRSRDPAERLAVLGVYFPDVAPWDVLLRYLGHARLPSERKRIACLALARHADRLPEPVRSALRELIPQLKATVPALNALGEPFGGAGMILAAAVGALDDQALTGGLPGLLSGSPPERRDAAALIGRLGRPEFTAALVALLGDPHPEVRGEAACALAMRVGSMDTGTDPLATAGLQRALTDPGARTPLAIADGLPALGTPSDQARELIRPLLDHPSALVRETAARAVHGSAGP